MVRTINRSKDIYSSTKNKMSDNAEQLEQITKTPSNVPKKEKDPKRVAAGKKLAESNKRMREEHARYKAFEAQRVTKSPADTPDPETETEGSEWFPKLSLTNVISLVGIGLTVYNIFLRSREKQPTIDKSNKHSEPWREPVTTTFEELEMRPKPKFGM